MFKDLPEGQTHYENDGCGEPSHNKHMEPKQLTQDEKEQRVLENILNVLQAIELQSLNNNTFESLAYAKGMLQGFISIKYKNK